MVPHTSQMSVFVPLNTRQKFFSFVDLFFVMSDNIAPVVLPWCTTRRKTEEMGTKTQGAYFLLWKFKIRCLHSVEKS